jgi:hypothetical protein
MPTYNTPGVYIAEVPGPGPIVGVGTGTAALIGGAVKGPINVPTRITSWTQFTEQFGEWPSVPGSHLAHAARGFFGNGGTVCYITRIEPVDGDALTQYQAALAALEKVDDVNLVSVPDRTDVDCQSAVIAHCEALGDRFAILDSPLNAPPFGAGSVLAHRSAVESHRGYAALYYPWIRIKNAERLTGEDTILVPPSGHLAGIFARADAEHGVHRSPANEPVRGAIGLEQVIDDAENGQLNVEGVNVLRMLPGRARPVVWGARTTAPTDDTAWRYTNVRRLVLFVEESIGKGLRWATFEPNNVELWKKLQRTVIDFLTGVWRSGALVGETAQEAFYVRVDEALNTPSVRALGQVVIEIGIAPVRPAEFMVVRVRLWDGGVEVAET